MAIKVQEVNEPQAPEHAYALSRLGRALSEQGQDQEALALLYRAKLIHDRGNSSPEEVAYTKLHQAKALTRASRKREDRARARALAEEALALLHDHVGHDYERSQIEAWLAAHPK